jgi:hypothetical protein
MIFKQCRQRWEFSSPLRQNLEPITPVDPLFFGIAIHEGLGAYYDPTSPRSASFGMATFAAHLDTWEQENKDMVDDERKLWLTNMRELGRGMLSYYFSWAAKNDDFEVIEVEEEFEVEIPGLPGVGYTFRTDGLVKDKHDRLWLLEHKTTAQFADNSDWLMMDDQVGTYLWGLFQAKGYEIEGCIYNSLKKKAPVHLEWLKSGRFSMNKSQDTTFDIALADIKLAYEGKVPKQYHEFLDFLKFQKPNGFVKRELVRRNRREIEILGKSLRHEVMDMINDPHIYRSPGRQTCGWCPFIAPCLLKWEGGDVTSTIESMYKPKEGYHGRGW